MANGWMGENFTVTKLSKWSVGGTLAAVLLLCGASVGAEGQAAVAAPAVTAGSGMLHVSRSWIETYMNIRFLRVQGTIDGVKVELMAAYAFGKTWVVAPGDYPVKVTRDEKTEKGISRSYSVELMPGKRQDFDLTGLAE